MRNIRISNAHNKAPFSIKEYKRPIRDRTGNYQEKIKFFFLGGRVMLYEYNGRILHVEISAGEST